MKVIEIFESIEGEGVRAGQLATFIRLAGCNLRCPYCDTKYSWDTSEAKDMDVDEILQVVRDLGVCNITLTGGEPLVHPGVQELLQELVEDGCCVNVETNGSVDIEPFRRPQVFFTVDYKGPSSGQEEKMFLPMFRTLREQDVLKFVVGTKEDLDRARLVCDLLAPECTIYVSTVFGELKPADVVNYMVSHNLQDWHLQLQLHKYVWDPEKRGV